MIVRYCGAKAAGSVVGGGGRVVHCCTIAVHCFSCSYLAVHAKTKIVVPGGSCAQIMNHECMEGTVV